MRQPLSPPPLSSSTQIILQSMRSPQSPAQAHHRSFGWGHIHCSGGFENPECTWWKRNYETLISPLLSFTWDWATRQWERPPRASNTRGVSDSLGLDPKITFERLRSESLGLEERRRKKKMAERTPCFPTQPACKKPPRTGPDSVDFEGRGIVVQRQQRIQVLTHRGTLIFCMYSTEGQAGCQWFGRMKAALLKDTQPTQD